MSSSSAMKRPIVGSIPSVSKKPAETNPISISFGLDGIVGQGTRPVPDSSQPRERSGLLAVVEELGPGAGRSDPPLLGQHCLQQDEVCGVVIGKRPKKDAIHHAEYGGVRADSERERQGDHQSEPGPLEKRPDAVAEVLEQGIHDFPVSLRAPNDKDVQHECHSQAPRNRT